MKKLIALLTAAVMSLTMLAACGSKDDKESAASGDRSNIREAGAKALGFGAALLLPSMSSYVSKSKLKSANSNAKLVYVTVANACADAIADGNSSRIQVGKTGPLKISDLDESDFIQKSVKEAMNSNASGNGYVYWEIEPGTYKPIFAQWSPDGKDSSQVGQYPDPNRDPQTVFRFGKYNSY